MAEFSSMIAVFDQLTLYSSVKSNRAHAGFGVSGAICWLQMRITSSRWRIDVWTLNTFDIVQRIDIIV